MHGLVEESIIGSLKFEMSEMRPLETREIAILNENIVRF